MGDFLELNNVLDWEREEGEPESQSGDADVHLWQLAGLLCHDSGLDAGGASSQHGAVHLKFNSATVEFTKLGYLHHRKGCEQRHG